MTKPATPMTDAIRTKGQGGKCQDWRAERVAALTLARKLESDRARLIEALNEIFELRSTLMNALNAGGARFAGGPGAHLIPELFEKIRSLLRELEVK